MYTIPARVYVSQTDEAGVLRLDAAVDLLQDCSQMWFESEPALQAYFKKYNVNQMIAYRQVDVLRMPAYGERLRVETRIFECKNYYGYRNTLLYDEKEACCIQSWSIGAFVSLDSGRLVRMPDEVAALVVMDERADMPYTDKRVHLPTEGWQDLPAFSPRRADIDLNRHMNNARYVETALELLPRSFTPKRLRVEYRLPIKEGDMIRPRMGLPPGSAFIAMENEAGKPYALMRFDDSL